MEDIFKTILVVGSIWLLVVVFGHWIDDRTRVKMETAYAEGQMDAKKGDYKIRYDSIHSVWYWTGSPWVSGRPATANINNIKN